MEARWLEAGIERVLGLHDGRGSRWLQNGTEGAQQLYSGAEGAWELQAAMSSEALGCGGGSSVVLDWGEMNSSTPSWNRGSSATLGCGVGSDIFFPKR